MRIDFKTGTFYLGDCLEQMRQMPTGSVHSVLTDPPYSSGTRREASKGLRNNMTRGLEDTAWFGTDSLTTDGFTWLIRSCAVEWQRLLVPGGHALVFIDWRMGPAMASAIESADLRKNGLLVWDKTYFGMGAHFRNQHELIYHFTKGVGSAPRRRDVGNVLSHKPVRHGGHPTEKPVDLLTRLLQVVSDAGDCVLDPFAGSGSTLDAACRSRRRFVGVERDPEYFAKAIARVYDAEAAMA